MINFSLSNNQHFKIENSKLDVQSSKNVEYSMLINEF